jgi:sialate O-acetylesterase
MTMRSMKLSSLFLGAGLLLALASSARAEVKVPAIIGDNMVLQRGAKVRVWGTAQPSEKVSVAFAGQTASASADARGRWQVQLGPFEAGGPHTMTIAGTNTVTLSNILVGEVWVASGQSNMEWPLQSSAGADREIPGASHPEIRLFTVAKATATEPRDDVQGRWLVCSPEMVGQFSAVAYFFGRELNQKLRVPVGLINTSWGGTPAEAWTSRSSLGADPELKSFVEDFDRALENPDAQREYERLRAQWEEKNYAQDPGNKGYDLGYAKPDVAGDGWQKMRLPQAWEAAGLKADGAIWFRREVEIPESRAGKDLVLNLGPVDDFDTTYFNGTKVGAIGPETPDSWQVPRKYTVPGNLVRAGRNVIAVRVFDHYGNGGFGGAPGDMKLEVAGGENAAALPLGGEWDYRAELALEPIQPDFSTAPVAPPGAGNPNTPTVLYNAMIAPLTPYAIRGAIWYQGESNASRAAQYRRLFPAMIRDWRRAWGGGDFPFYFVQLANFMQTAAEPGESEWAELREAQLMTLKQPATGMAVIIDIGEADDIHPRNKHDVGHRLALAALARTYGQKEEYSGPLYESSSVEGNKVRVRFKHAGGLKTKDGGPVKGFAVAGEDRKFVWAEAKIEGDEVVVWSDRVARPIAVRYAWADNPVANLYNGAGLPASPFRTDSWPRVSAAEKGR